MLLKEIEALEALPRTDARDREIEQQRRRIEGVRAELYRSLTPWQRVLVARHPDRPEPRRLHPAPLHQLRRDPRRSPLRRRPRADDRLRRLQGPAGAARRPRQGPGHEGEDLPELRLRAAGGLPQGAARDAARRKVQPRDRRVRRHAGGVSGHRVGGARRGRSDCREPARHDDARHADHRDRQRRRRQRRRARHRRRRSRADAGVRDLQRHPARRAARRSSGAIPRRRSRPRRR